MNGKNNRMNGKAEKCFRVRMSGKKISGKGGMEGKESEGRKAFFPASVTRFPGLRFPGKDKPARQVL